MTRHATKLGNHGHDLNHVLDGISLVREVAKVLNEELEGIILNKDVSRVASGLIIVLKDLLIGVSSMGPTTSMAVSVLSWPRRLIMEGRC